jgi:hypothetical protein
MLPGKLFGEVKSCSVQVSCEGNISMSWPGINKVTCKVQLLYLPEDVCVINMHFKLKSD